MWYWCKKKPVKCVICKNYFCNGKFRQHKDNICLKCFDKCMRREPVRFYTLDKDECDELY